MTTRCEKANHGEEIESRQGWQVFSKAEGKPTRPHQLQRFWKKCQQKDLALTFGWRTNKTRPKNKNDVKMCVWHCVLCVCVSRSMSFFSENHGARHGGEIDLCFLSRLGQTLQALRVLAQVDVLSGSKSVGQPILVQGNTGWRNKHQLTSRQAKQMQRLRQGEST